MVAVVVVVIEVAIEIIIKHNTFCKPLWIKEAVAPTRVNINKNHLVVRW